MQLNKLNSCIFLRRVYIQILNTLAVTAVMNESKKKSNFLTRRTMKQKNKKEVSFFRLKLESYMSEHHPERLGDKEFITARADMALTAYCDAVAQGFNHLEAERIASEVLFSGLHFSKYDTLVSVLEDEFERELPAPLPERLSLLLLANKAVQATFAGYELTDAFAASGQYDRLYTELTGTIVLLIESNNLPTVKQTEEASPKAL